MGRCWCELVWWLVVWLLRVWNCFSSWNIVHSILICIQFVISLNSFILIASISQFWSLSTHSNSRTPNFELSCFLLLASVLRGISFYGSTWFFLSLSLSLTFFCCISKCGPVVGQFARLLLWIVSYAWWFHAVFYAAFISCCEKRVCIDIFLFFTPEINVAFKTLNGYPFLVRMWYTRACILLFLISFIMWIMKIFLYN